MVSIVQVFLERLESESEEHRDLVPFFKIIFTYFYVFPVSEHSRFVDRKSFTRALSNETDFPKLAFILELFGLKEALSIIEYLNKSMWWWESIKEMNRDGIDIYQLSYLYESLSQSKMKKTTGTFFTPKNQVKFITRFSLYKLLSLNESLAHEKPLLHRLIFHGILSDETPTIISSLINQITSLSIIDPCCGTGLFLHEILTIFSLIFSKIGTTPNHEEIFQKIYGNLHGFDIDSNHILLTKLVFLRHWTTQVVPSDAVTVEAMVEFLDSLGNIQHKDYLLEKDVLNSKYDLCLGNPPYIRHHDINKKKIIEHLVQLPEFRSVFTRENQQIDSKADLYFYFWIKLMLNLNPKGVLGLVLSRSWYSSRFLAPLNRLLFEKYFNLDLILELPSEPWETAEIITNIVIGHKIEHFDTVQSTAVLVWKKTLSHLLKIPESLSAYVTRVEKVQSTIIPDVTIESYENEEYRMSQISNPHHLFSHEQSNLFPALRIDYFTMAPFFLHHVLLINKNKFCLLSQLGKLSLGSTTGANKFFYLTEETIQSYGLPKKYLVPMTKSPKDNISISTISPSKSISLLCVPSNVNPEEDQKLKFYLDSQKDNLLLRPYFRNKSKSNWYRIAKIQPEIIIPNMTYLRSFVAYNKQKFHIDKQWIGFWPKNPSWTTYLLGFMNSSLGLLLREIQGTRSLGLGSLKLSLKECQNLLVLDPRLVSETIIHQIGEYLEEMMELPIPRIGEKSKYTSIQTKLDKLICIEYLGLSSQIINKIRKSIAFEVAWRLGKSKSY